MDSAAHDAQTGSHTIRIGRDLLFLKVALVLVCILPFVLMWDLTRALFGLVLTDPTYSHLPFIPLMSAFLIYTERQTIFTQTSRGWRAGGFLAAAGVTSLFLAQVNPWQWSLANRLSLLGLGLVLLGTGAFALMFGIHAFRAAHFSLLLLLFAVPIPEWILSKSIFFLQTWSAEATDALFHLIGMPYFRTGFDFMLPTVTIRIAEECSGIRSTLMLLLMSALAGHLFLKSNSRIFILCVLAIPISIAKNGFRIAALSYLGVYVDRSFLDGPLHHQGGILFFILGLLLMVMVLLVLRRFERQPRHREPNLALPQA
jgi:exosortase